MKVYITDLEAYNNGRLVGTWYKLPMSEDELTKACDDVLAIGKHACKHEHNHEELFITDYEDFPFKVEEFSNIHELNKKAQVLEDMEEKDDIKKISMLMTNGLYTDFYEACEHVDELMDTGETDMSDIAYNIVEESGALSTCGNLGAYFDYEKYGRDLDIEGSYYQEENSNIYEFVG